MNTAKVRRLSSIEPLESRIAPARIILAGAPDTLSHHGDVNYNDSDPVKDAIFVNIKNAPPTDLIARALGGANATADTYYLRMFAGDVLKLFTATNGFTDPFYTQINGNGLVFLQDINGDNEVQPNEITGIALGKNAAIDIKGGVHGDIVANLDEKGTPLQTADDRLMMTGLVSSQQNIKSLTISSSVGRDIIAGGTIDKVRVFGAVDNVLAGSAANGATIDFFPGAAGTGKGKISFSTPTGAGASITNLTVDNVGGRVEAGGGGTAAVGGSLTNIQVTDDPDGMILKAGKGGAASAALRIGGRGGNVDSVFITGVDDATPNDLIQIQAGNGGDASSFAQGGAGGRINKIFVGSSVIGGGVFPSASLLRDDVNIAAGTGGAGKTGGNGGAVSNVDVNIATPNGLGHEISVFAGNGGSAKVTSGYTGGIGGSINAVSLRNESPISGGLTSILMKAGAGGTGSLAAYGRIGGSITNSTVRGFNVSVLAGDGSDGKIGGIGGSLTSIVAEQGEGVFLRMGDFESGHGGKSFAGSGGKGGDLASVTVNNSDVSSLKIIGGDGGDAIHGRGGAGGAVSKLALVDGGGAGIVGAFAVASGSGGDGTNGGGNGGALSAVKFSGIDTSIAVQSGNGGSASGTGASGSGGVAGNISDLGLGTIDSLGGGNAPGGSILSGTGGNAAGNQAPGGAGGNISNANLNVAGAVSVIAGNGGNGSHAAAGRGGSITNASAFGQAGAGELLAGNGGVIGSLPAAGGSISGTSSGQISGLFASGALTIKAGNGTHGGAGGNITFVGYGSSSLTLVPTPAGDILVQAGAGSAGSVQAGVGGNIVNVSGAVASSNTGTPTNTTIIAGNGGGSPSISAPGGKISNLDLRRGGNAGGVLTIKAGDAGDSPGDVQGAAGGAVSGVSISEIEVTNIVRSIAAGDGGNAKTTGGVGGSVNQIDVVDHDLGVRSGKAFGYNSMGGIFAGAGGSGVVEGQAGSVSNVRAQMIAAIVAGRGAAPKLANSVSSIYVGTPTDLLEVSKGNVNADGSYDAPRYAVATFVGAVKAPSVPGANRFHFNDANGDGIFEVGEVPIDGLIMAKTYDAKTTNFTPEARLTGGEFQFTETTPGSSGVHEVQQLKLVASKFTFAFEGDETATLLSGATATAVATALNALPSMIAAGGVHVLQTGQQTYVVTFDKSGARNAIVAPFYYDFDNVY